MSADFNRHGGVGAIGGVVGTAGVPAPASMAALLARRFAGNGSTENAKKASSSRNRKSGKSGAVKPRRLEIAFTPPTPALPVRIVVPQSRQPPREARNRAVARQNGMLNEIPLLVPKVASEPEAPPPSLDFVLPPLALPVLFASPLMPAAPDIFSPPPIVVTVAVPPPTTTTTQKRQRQRLRASTGGKNARRACGDGATPSDSYRVDYEMMRGHSALEMGDEPVYEHDCGLCHPDQWATQQDRIDGILPMPLSAAAHNADARGLIHTFFSLRHYYKPLYELYFLKFGRAPPAGTNYFDPAGEAQQRLRALLARFGIEPEQRCEALIEQFDYPRGVHHGEVRAPMLCPNVDAVLKCAADALMRDVDMGKDVEIANTFYRTVVQPSIAFFHELGVRRRRNPRCGDTLSSLNNEFNTRRRNDPLLRIIEHQLMSPSSSVLAACQEFGRRQNDPRTHFCLTVSQHVERTARMIYQTLIVQRDYDRAELQFCGALHRPGYSFSYREYLWPDALECTIGDLRIVWRNGQPQLPPAELPRYPGGFQRIVQPEAASDDDFFNRFTEEQPTHGVLYSPRNSSNFEQYFTH